MRVSLATALVAGAAGVFSGCGSEAADAPVAVPSSGTAYRALNDGERLAVAASCRDRAAARADGWQRTSSDEWTHARCASSSTWRSG